MNIIFFPGQMWMMQKFLPAMINLNDGSIVSMCSIAGHMGTPYMVPYSASKHGVKGDIIYNKFML